MNFLFCAIFIFIFYIPASSILEAGGGLSVITPRWWTFNFVIWTKLFWFIYRIRTNTLVLLCTFDFYLIFIHFVTKLFAAYYKVVKTFIGFLYFHQHHRQQLNRNLILPFLSFWVEKLEVERNYDQKQNMSVIEVTLGKILKIEYIWDWGFIKIARYKSFKNLLFIEYPIKPYGGAIAGWSSIHGENNAMLPIDPDTLLIDPNQ